MKPIITDSVWRKFEPIFMNCKLKRGKDDRNFLEAVCWVMRTGCPWSSLPREFGPWKTAYNRYVRSIKGNYLRQILSDLKEIEKVKRMHNYS
jgi:transposase